MPKIDEFHCIMPITNMPSVMEHGILSYELASRLDHESVAMHEVQERRDKKEIPGGLKLHRYANLYFHARNPMLRKRVTEADNLCVLRIDSKIGHSEGVVFSDGNAASDWARFYTYTQIQDKTADLPFSQIFANDWTDEDELTYRRKKFHKCAEILVPEQIPPKFICGAYVVNRQAKASLLATGFSTQVTIDKRLFFK